jgi:tRNA nucleotidyltransferase (CCA-adding enzyme)
VKVITTHLSADFDAFAAAVCATRLFPDHRVLLPGSAEAAVRRFLDEVALPYPELRLRSARRERLEHAVVVDTRSSTRLGEVWDLIVRDRCPVTLIDHHVDEPDGLGATRIESRPLGATCSIIAQLFSEGGFRPTAEEASLMLMGMYEDTGGLSYRETTAEDLRIAAWLLEHGGSLEWVRQWVLKGLVPTQLELLNRLVAATETIRIHDVRVSLAMVELDHYHEEAAYVVHRWVETFDLQVAIAMLVQPPHVTLIMRSKIPGLHVGRIAQVFGGGGHATAASARIADRVPVEVREKLLQVLDAEMPPAATALDIAVRNLVTTTDSATVEETKHLLNRRRVNAVPVRDATGRLVGTVTRQLLDHAISHNLDDRPVATVMRSEVPTVPATASLDELRREFLERSHRFVVVERDGVPVGLVTRMDLFRRLFGGQSDSGAALDHRMAELRPISQSIPRMLRESTTPWVRDLMATARAVANTVGISVYLVGGLVRDLLLGRHNEDVDLVVEGSGIDFAHALAAYTGGRCHPHEPFLTAVVTLPDGHSVDVASARTEFYRTPAALPEVATSLLRQDLYRRDFTVNALAIALHGDRHGELVDFFGGRRDLDRREIRVLHSLSFIDDPTRAIRAVRYARRLDFRVAADTRNLITTAVAEGVFRQLSGDRLRRELQLLLREPHPAPSLAMLADFGLLGAISPRLQWSEDVHALLLEVEGQLAWFQLESMGPPPDVFTLFLGALMFASGPDAVDDVVARLKLSGRAAQCLVTLADTVATATTAADDGRRPSERVALLEDRSSEGILLAMARLDLASRQRLARALEAGIRTGMPATGADLVATGIAPGPWIGRALRDTRWAILDGEIASDEAVGWATARAHELEKSWLR